MQAPLGMHYVEQTVRMLAYRSKNTRVKMAWPWTHRATDHRRASRLVVAAQATEVGTRSGGHVIYRHRTA